MIRDALAAFHRTARRPWRLWQPSGLGVLAAGLRAGWRIGVLILATPDGREHRLEGEEPGPCARLEIHSPRFLGRVLRSGDVGFADSFVAGEWNSPDLGALLSVLAANLDGVAGALAGRFLPRLAGAFAHAMNRNSRAGARRNIEAHYDLGNAFYGLWLDPGMNYSSALFAGEALSLAAGQAVKHRALARAMDLRPGCRMLEIGCGWGDFAGFAASECGARVTAVTLSPAQRDFAARRIFERGLADRVAVELRDWRDIVGRFDRIASIEMLEAVGERGWGAFFARLSALLAPEGRIGLQTITIAEELFADYRRRPDFIQLRVFPGGMLPSEAGLAAQTSRAGLAWTSVRRFGADYADTLAEWSRRYRARAAQVRAQGFDERFDRLWRYYLAYCEAGFRSGRTDVMQIGLAAG